MSVKFEWTFPDSVIFLPHSYLVIAVWLFCCRHSGKADRMEDDFCMENNFLSLIKTRRSVRAYKAEPVPPEALDAVLEAGTYAPTGGGRQSPTIIAITDPKYRQEIAKLNAEVMGSSTDPYYGAPVVVLVLADGSASTFVEDGSCRKPCAVSGRLHWGIQPRKPVNPQHANKTISFGFNDSAVRRNFLRRTLCGEEGTYAGQ